MERFYIVNEGRSPKDFNYKSLKLEVFMFEKEMVNSRPYSRKFSNDDSKIAKILGKT